MVFTVENIVIGVVVAGTVAWAVRAGVRSVRKTGGCSSCATSGDCPLSNDPEALDRIARGEEMAPPTACRAVPREWIELGALPDGSAAGSGAAPDAASTRPPRA
ncbi:FeoB-associated Cys-rich membrane protein [bacterium]|nr:FeoB-associated Cys-rich membrane protein [bacterium]